MKGKINFIIDVLMMLLMAAIAGLGFMVKFVLISGKDRVAKFGHQGDVYFLGMDRHEWGTVHLVIGFVLLGLLVLHIVLHWRTITCLFRQLIGKKNVRIWLTTIFSLLCLALFVLPFFVPVTFVETGPGFGQNSIRHAIHPNSMVKPAAAESVAVSAPESGKRHGGDSTAQHHDSHEHHQSDIQIQGNMTLQQVSGQYNIPVDVILSGLKIAEAIPPTETLGRLKKRYAFTMSDVETIILRYQSESRNHQD